LEASLGGKWLELLSEIAPAIKRAAIMFNPDTTPVSTFMPSLETAARSLKIASVIAPVRSDVEIETAIMALAREPGGGLVNVPDGFLIAHRAPIILAAARNKVPAVYTLSEAARGGGLLSYGVDQVDTYRRAATAESRPPPPTGLWQRWVISGAPDRDRGRVYVCSYPDSYRF
jgi:putative ABC transport system substrate-binding protein